MDELRRAVSALAGEVRAIERQMATCGGPPSKSQLRGLQEGVNRIQQSLNRLQTAVDAWSEEKQEV